MSERIDLTGRKFERLKVISYAGKTKNGKSLWKCECKCGNIAIVRSDRLKNGDTKSCGCLYRKDLTGQRFNNLKVISYAGKTKNGKSLWKCECKCGNIAIVQSDRLKNGDTKSCGCEKIRKIKEKSTIHGNSKKRLYRIWRGMINRTSNENVKEYHRYGGRGISVCEEWMDNFECFEKWSMENGYKDNLTIDRKNNDGNYSPENCRWVSWKVQESNRGDVKKYMYKGSLKTIPQLAEMANMRIETLRGRIKRGMDIVEAVEAPVQGKNAGYKPY